jgi:short-subunit dehydrogenase
MSAPILIFGATGGVGSALARTLQGNGHDLVLSGRNDDRLTALAQDLGARAIPADVLSDDALGAVIGEAVGDDGLAGLAFCVGSIDLKPLKRVEADDLMRARCESQHCCSKPDEDRDGRTHRLLRRHGGRYRQASPDPASR